MNEYEIKLFEYIDNGNLLEINKLFIEHRDKININVKTKDMNETPLYRAVRLNNLSIVSFLLTDKQINVNTLDFYDGYALPENWSSTPLIRAIHNKNIDMIKILLSHKEINVNLVPNALKNKGLSNNINRAGDINKRTEIVKLLLAHGDLNRKTIENIQDLDEMTRLDPEIGILLATLNEKRNIEDKSESESENKTITVYYKQWNCLLI